MQSAVTAKIKHHQRLEIRESRAQFGAI